MYVCADASLSAMVSYLCWRKHIFRVLRITTFTSQVATGSQIFLVRVTWCRTVTPCLWKWKKLSLLSHPPAPPPLLSSALLSSLLLSAPLRCGGQRTDTAETSARGRGKVGERVRLHRPLFHARPWRTWCWQEAVLLLSARSLLRIVLSAASVSGQSSSCSVVVFTVSRCAAANAVSRLFV